MLRLLAALLIPVLGVLISAFSEMVPGHMAHHTPALLLVGSAFVHSGAAVVFVVLVNLLLWPWITFESLANGTGVFAGMDVNIRAAFVLGWSLILAAFVLGFASAGV